ncbi:hypothetical protein C0J52_09450 [Blattella germanica]|nr:hypothetical protein C0J52_09450 [Blattella germanica]
MEGMMKLTTQNPLSFLVKFGIMAWNGTCADNCSGHGECHNGTCLCEIQFDGPECHVPNLSYYIAFATIFFLLALICFIQLVMCIVAEWQRMKAPSILRACRVTTQKLLYFVVFLASIIRGAYFTSPAAFEEGWSSSLMSAYYPLVLSGSSLVVCFWAEVFHLRDIRWEKPQFLSKSFLGFLTFNIITYSLLLAEFVTTQFANTTVEEKSFYTHVFNGCYAVLMFIVVIFFLIYGVEVFFKVRGGFLLETTVKTIATSSRTPAAGEPGTDSTDPAATRLFASRDSNPLPQQSINTSQLHQSRVPLTSRNWHDVVFRVVEIGVTLWFPCVLWNCMRYFFSSASPDSLRCKVCGSAYQVEQGTRLDWQHGFTTQHWLQTAAIVTVMCVSAAGAWIVIQLFEDPLIRMLAAGSALLIVYVCVRLVCFV